MKKRTVWSDIAADIDRFRLTDRRSVWTMPLMCPAMLSCVMYRLQHAVWGYHGRLRFLVPPLKVILMIVGRFVEVYTGIWISPRAEVGPGLYIGHFGGVILGEVKMGSNCNLSPGVVLGQAVRGPKKGRPTIGDRVYIAAGAKLFGKITIGDDVAIGANAVVTESLPDKAVAVGIPAKVISLKGSFGYILYRDMDAVPERDADDELEFFGAGNGNHVGDIVTG
jgi:serine O-acetyltransferase